MRTAVIVEPRRHAALHFVLKNFTENLDTTWKILIFHGTTNKDFVKEAMSSLPSDRFLPPIQLEVTNLTIRQYNLLLMHHAFYQCIPTETFLIFQTDSMILEPSYLEAFLDYDYVGAPWLNHGVGNGGLSLRKKRKMLDITNRILPSDMNEDQHIACQQLIPMKKPPFEMAKRFSVETVFHERSFGIHVPWKYLRAEDMARLIERYPAIQILIDLQRTDTI